VLQQFSEMGKTGNFQEFKDLTAESSIFGSVDSLPAKIFDPFPGMRRERFCHINIVLDRKRTMLQ
jgi:hypothetical protein